MKGGSKPHLYEVGAEQTRPAAKKRVRPVASVATIPEPRWATIFGCPASRPSDVAKAARRLWRNLLPQLRATGNLSPTDASLLEELCICRARIMGCEQEIGRNGLVIDGPRGPVKNPATTIASQYRSRLKVCEEQLGIGSMNRLRLPPPAPPEDNDDDLDQAPD